MTCAAGSRSNLDAKPVQRAEELPVVTDLRVRRREVKQADVLAGMPGGHRRDQTTAGARLDGVTAIAGVAPMT